MAKRWWLVPIVGIGGVLLYREMRGGSLRHLARRIDTGEMANPEAYDAYSSLLGGLYTKIALEVVDSRPEGRMLDIGCGPGRLDVRLGVMMPSVEVTGVDVDPRMVELASANAAGAGVSRRVQFQVGDSAALPLGDDEFDLVVSTLSLHHWADPSRAFSEIYRVLKPAGEVRIYDVPDRVRQFIHGGETMLELAQASPFDWGMVETIRWPGPIPSLRCLRMRKPRG